ncbi:MAG: prepilin-type N-terminal cleavage/methylation domain-containing protein [Phycisphaerae bacterium]|nr:prepilin-type N-terminal cleavage/methylation domain-containing protein [Phycisphaerae bacterium]
MRRRGFSMVEVVVVTVMLAVLAAVLLPRAGGREARAERAVVEGVRLLLDAAGQRRVLSGQPVALEYETRADGGILAVSSWRKPVRSWDPPWSRDPLIAPVNLESLTLTNAQEDGRRLEGAAWRVDLSRSGMTGTRPGLRLILASARSGQRWSVSLEPNAISATCREWGDAEPDPMGDSRAVDLDRTGRREQPW